MKKYLLDTSLVAGYLLNREKAIALVSPLIERAEAATSMLVYGEVIEYLKGLPHYQEKYAALHTILNEIPPYPLTYAILERYAEIRRTLRPLHQEIGDIDTLIAATALEERVTLVTIDRDFERVPHLKVKLIDLKVA